MNLCQVIVCVLSTLLVAYAAQVEDRPGENRTVAGGHALPQKMSLLQSRGSSGPVNQEAWDQDRVADVARAIYKKAEELKESHRLSCSKNQYYDVNTQNCEDCINLCKNFNPQMCRLYCPDVSLTLEYDLPQLAGRLASLAAVNEDQKRKITELESQIKTLHAALQRDSENTNLSLQRRQREAEKLEAGVANLNREATSFKSLSATIESEHVTMNREVGRSTAASAAALVLSILVVLGLLLFFLMSTIRNTKKSRSTDDDLPPTDSNKSLLSNPSPRPGSEGLTKKPITENAHDDVTVDLTEHQPSTQKFPPSNYPPADDESNVTMTQLAQPRQGGQGGYYNSDAETYPLGHH